MPMIDFNDRERAVAVAALGSSGASVVSALAFAVAVPGLSALAISVAALATVFGGTALAPALTYGINKVAFPKNDAKVVPYLGRALAVAAPVAAGALAFKQLAPMIA